MSNNATTNYSAPLPQPSRPLAEGVEQIINALRVLDQAIKNAEKKANGETPAGHASNLIDDASNTRPLLTLLRDVLADGPWPGAGRYGLYLHDGKLALGSPTGKAWVLQQHDDGSITPHELMTAGRFASMQDALNQSPGLMIGANIGFDLAILGGIEAKSLASIRRPFIESGSWTTPSDGYVRITAVGPGSGGGGVDGGASGAWGVVSVRVAAGDVVTVTVGAPTNGVIETNAYSAKTYAANAGSTIVMLPGATAVAPGGLGNPTGTHGTVAATGFDVWGYGVRGNVASKYNNGWIGCGGAGVDLYLTQQGRVPGTARAGIGYLSNALGDAVDDYGVPASGRFVGGNGGQSSAGAPGGLGAGGGGGALYTSGATWVFAAGGRGGNGWAQIEFFPNPD